MLFNLLDEKWNVLTSPWLEVMTVDAVPKTCSPLTAMQEASKIRSITLGSPLDFFAAHRFLITLLYWKADEVEGVLQIRDALLKGEVPSKLLLAIERSQDCFELFHNKKPFMQDPTLDKFKESPGSLFTEYASGTNIAHFHHGDDKEMRLCLQCATLGMLRLVPWTQVGGAGKSASIHNAPPIMVIASGQNLAVTLGMNLVPLSTDKGKVQWTGHFIPTNLNEIPFLEALTWNPRRVRLKLDKERKTCWGCGKTETSVVGPIAYAKNENTKNPSTKTPKEPFKWVDPSAFYSQKKPFNPARSTRENDATNGKDLQRFANDKDPLNALVGRENPKTECWNLIVPCINPANNKTYDHRKLELNGLLMETIHTLPPPSKPQKPIEIDGWTEPTKGLHHKGAVRFVKTAVQILTDGDWSALKAAINREMHHSPAAFNVFAGVFWGLREKAWVPARNVAWLVLKLMASVPSSGRIFQADASFCPLHTLPKRQINERRHNKSIQSPYPKSLPQGHVLETALREALNKNFRKRYPEYVDWAGLCSRLDLMLD